MNTASAWLTVTLQRRTSPTYAEIRPPVTQPRKRQLGAGDTAPCTTPSVTPYFNKLFHNACNYSSVDFLSWLGSGSCTRSGSLPYGIFAIFVTGCAAMLTRAAPAAARACTPTAGTVTSGTFTTPSRFYLKTSWPLTAPFGLVLSSIPEKFQRCSGQPPHSTSAPIMSKGR